jgi:hypothetical protein
MVIKVQNIFMLEVLANIENKTTKEDCCEIYPDIYNFVVVNFVGQKSCLILMESIFLLVNMIAGFYHQTVSI